MKAEGKLMDMLTGYAASHQQPFNIFVHMIGIPTIMLGILIPLTWVGFAINEFHFYVAHVVIFGLFLWGDISCLSAWSTILNHEMKKRSKKGVQGQDNDLDGRIEELNKTINTLKLYIQGCDLPGVMGLVIIFLVSLCLCNAPNEYGHGFSAGATCIHIIFTQTVLAFVSPTD